MIDPAITRRDMLGLLAGCVIAGITRNSFSADSQAGQPENTLLRIARLLYPHEALSDKVYLDVIAPLQVALADRSSPAGPLTAGRASLNDAAGGDWLGADMQTQIAALRSIESSAFFQTVREAVRTKLYNHPAVWELLGFEGSSVEYGGYIDRGFADIDWLPED